MSKKQLANTKKSNKAKPITEDLALEVVENIVTGKQGDKRDKFFLLWLFGLKQKTAAKMCGYSESWASKLVKMFREDAKTRQRIEKIADLMPDTYRKVCKLRLPQIAQIEGKALAEYDKQPILAIDKPQLLKAVKAGAGVATDEAVSPRFVSIETLQFIQNVVHEQQTALVDTKQIIGLEDGERQR